MNGVAPTVTLPADVHVIATNFNPANGVLTTSLSDGTSLTANIGVAAADKFLTSTVYDASTSSLKLTMSDGTVMTVPLADLVKVATDGLAIQGDGTTGTPVKLVLDPASSGIAATQTAAGLKLVVAPPAATTNTITISGSTVTTVVNGVTATATLPATPATTVSNVVTGSGASQTLITTVNGVAAAPVSLPDLDAQTLSLAGQVLTISNGNSVTIPVPAPYTGGTTNTAKVTVAGQVITADVIIDPTSTPGAISATAAGIKVVIPAPAATTNTITISGSTVTTVVNGVTATATLPAAPAITNAISLTQGGGLDSTVSGVNSNQPIPVGTITNQLGFDKAGNLIYQAPAAPPATTVSNAVAGTGAARTLTTTVNGVTGAAVPIPDLDAQTLSLVGQVLTISNGNSVTIPIQPTTVSNAIGGTAAAPTLITTVNGVASAPVNLPIATANLALGPVAGTGASATRALVFTKPDGTTQSIALQPMVSGLQQVLIGFCFPAS